MYYNQYIVNLQQLFTAHYCWIYAILFGYYIYNQYRTNSENVDFRQKVPIFDTENYYEQVAWLMQLQPLCEQLYRDYKTH